MNLTIAWWWMFFAIPLIAIVPFLPAAKHGVAAVYVPFNLANVTAPREGWKHWPARLFFILGWVLLVLAAARPQLVNEEIVDNSMARNLVLSIDISESMLRKDMAVGSSFGSRLEAVKLVLTEFIEKRKGDQLGLVVFADNAYVQSPLSYDTEAITSLVKDLVVGLAGKRTAIGDALVLAVKVIQNNPIASKENASIILLSDGRNTWGKVTPEDALQLVKERGIRVHTIGFGSRRFGDALDERTLQAIATTTGGQFFRATNTTELRQVYGVIDKLNKVEIATYAYKKREEIYYWPLLLGLLAIIIGALFHTGLVHYVFTAKTSMT